MAKVQQITLVSLAICLSTLLGFAAAANPEEKFIVEGRVYCDTCRVEFETKISQPIKGASVKLECRNITNEKIASHSQDVVTDEAGGYKIEVKGDHEDEICEVSLVKSPRADCNEPTEVWRKARVVLTKADGVSGTYRFANNLGYMKKEALPECKKVLTEMGYFELQDEIGEEVEGHSTAP
ncbi:hypothetical protein ERO13_A04G041800v2 [Gossypium hirsutum]|uniref:Anther-specific protein LAT52 n=1 Tax=Gossypium hirsutum TaxID=3635 RepID=A0A1U8ITT5_GOSHI|nr:anther-specific protein LAT52 [Gossypium hirsutum]KAG4204337.1 hypothetical protein ERO13_A04G041800v2 [Gossypium hirsutum]